MKKTLLATVVLTTITSQAGAATQEEARTIGEGYQHAVRFNMTDVHNPDTLIDAHKLAHNPLFAGKEVGQKAQELMTHIYDAKAEQEAHWLTRNQQTPATPVIKVPQLEAPYSHPELLAPQAAPVKTPVAQVQQTPVKPAAPVAQPHLIPTVQQQTPVKQAVPTAQPQLIPTVQQQIPARAKAPELNPQPNRAIPAKQGETPEYAKQLIPTLTPDHATPSVIQQTPDKPVAAAPTLHPQPTKAQFTPDPIPNEGLAHAVRYNMTDVHNPDTLIHEEKLAHNPLFAGKDVAQKAQDHVAKLMTIKLEQESHYEARQATGSQEDDAQSAAIFQGAAVVLAKPAAAPAAAAAIPAAPAIDPTVQTALDEKADKTDLASLRTQFNGAQVSRIKNEADLGNRLDTVESNAAAAKTAQVTRDDDQDIRFNKQKAAQAAVDGKQDGEINKAAVAAVKEFNRATVAEQALSDRVDDHENRIHTLETAPKPQDGKDGKDGVNGANGADGKDGAQGQKGDKGDKGDQGIQGQQGATGAAGQKGDKGDAGAKGDKGDRGDQGIQGQQGVTGAAGQKGDKGDTGATGAAGRDGKDGLNGADGKDGAQGPKGDKGDTGAAGKDVDPTVVNQLKDGIKTNEDATKANKAIISQNEAEIAATVLKANANEQGVAANSKGVATNRDGVQKNATAIKLHEDHVQTLAQGELSVGRLAVQNNKALTKQVQDFTTLQTEVKQKVDTTVYQQRSAVVDQRFADTDARIHQQKLEQDKTNQKVAANSKELANHESRITDLEANNKTNFNKLQNQQNKDRNEFRAGVAGAVALTQIPQVQADQTGNFGMGVGTFNGENAIAAGISTRLSTSVTLKSGLSWDTQGNVGAGAGMAVGW
ncbi:MULTISPECIES: YadA-like family protein [Enterobacter]|uniref:YadA-like family protein n=1 Tax=Enterobacter TaxID=547 RepID=UPI0028E787F0|nr:YadA-like family protein [Enterobacter cloacae]HDR2791715.1 YadA-like family protein [Enterobacter asburiae]WNT38405.1 YadA-like family protein [Enterobacter cloacae]HDR2796656.1 YadA-like family protein [Enterobacter asburiae]HDR2797122.1 YadA-like family protein [Enterobacter asburiae]HDR2802062.1 YadA-like family protein [Enterobacter asburiae]